jgi:tRNA pseudouridine38-40 synthase
MPRVKLVLAYDGTAYHGSQIQSGVPTIQEELERGLQTLQARSGRTAFAGRTDAGVHAVGQVVSADVSWDDDADRLRRALNGVMPRDIRVRSAEFVNSSFHARFDAACREYRYRLAAGFDVTPMARRYVWTPTGALDDRLARSAAALFAGRHSFGSFASGGKSQEFNREELERTVHTCEWREIEDELLGIEGARTVREFRITASGFLPQMARNMVRAVVDVASGTKPLDWIEFLLVSGDRRLLGAPVPPHGLVLWRVGYSGDPGSRSQGTGDKAG